MIYFLQIIMILIAFFLSRKINLNLKNFDFPGKNKLYFGNWNLIHTL